MSSLLFFVCIVGTMQLVVVGQQVEAVNPSAIASNITSWTPVVLMHGTSHFLLLFYLFTYLLFYVFIFIFIFIYLISGSASSTATVQHTRNLLMQAMPGVYVKAIEIGNGILDSLFWPMDDQVPNHRHAAVSRVR